MMQVAVIYRGKDLISKELSKYGLKKSTKPKIVIAFGGEGTFLVADRKYPNIPKLLIYHSSKCTDCSRHNFSRILKALAEERFDLVETARIEASVKGKKLVGLNDVNIHYIPPTAIRYEVIIGQKKTGEVVGDGIVVATPYGSSAYFYSITRQRFNRGLGIAFNNTVKERKPMITKGPVKIKVIRGPGGLCVDCHDKTIALQEGDVIIIKTAKKTAQFIQLKGRPVKILKF